MCVFMCVCALPTPTERGHFGFTRDGVPLPLSKVNHSQKENIEIVDAHLQGDGKIKTKGEEIIVSIWK